MSDSSPQSSSEPLTPRNTPPSTPEFTVQWAAGFVDGEACIHIAKQRYRTKRRDTYRLGIYLTQNDLNVLEHFRDGVGVAAPIYEVKRTRQHRRQCYTLNYNGAKAMRVISLLAPHLVRKRSEADAAEAFWTFGRIGERPGPKGLEPQVVEIREHFYKHLKQLK